MIHSSYAAYNCCFTFVDFFVCFLFYLFFVRVHILAEYIFFYFVRFLICPSQSRTLANSRVECSRNCIQAACYIAMKCEFQVINKWIIISWCVCVCFGHTLIQVLFSLSYRLTNESDLVSKWPNSISLKKKKEISSYYLICTKSNIAPFDWKSNFHLHKTFFFQFNVYLSIRFNILMNRRQIVICPLTSVVFSVNIDCLILMVWIIVCLIKWMPLHRRCATML